MMVRKAKIVEVEMARKTMRKGERRSKWAVLNVTPSERAEITAAAKAAGLSINAFILGCTRRAHIVSPARQDAAIRHLSRIRGHLDLIARWIMADESPPVETADVLLMLWRIERGIQAPCRCKRDGNGGDGRDRDEGRGDAPC